MEIAKLYFNAILLLGFFSILFVGVAVYSRNRKDIINKVWSAVCFSVSLWCLFYFLTINAETKNSAVFLIKIANLFGVLVFVFWLYFVAVFLNIQKDKKFKLFYGLMIAFSIAVSYLILSPWFMKDIVPTYVFNYYLIPGFGYFVYAIYFLFATTGGLLFLFSHRKQFTGIKAGQFNFITFGSLIGFIGGGVAFLPSFGIYFPVYLLILFTTFPIIIAYGITKYNLFNIRVIATEAFIVAIWILLIYRSIVSYSSYQDFFINIGSLILIVAVGILLMRSVMREVEQREKIEKIEKDIEKAYEAEKLAKEKIDAIRVEDEALLSSIGEGVVAIDREGKVTFINRAAEQMLYLKSEEAVGRSYQEILKMETEKGEAVLKEKDPLNLALSSGKKVVTAVAEGTADIIYFYVRKDGTKFPSAITVAPVILNGKTIGAVDVFRDITVERQIDKSKTEFVSLASHQLRTPLSAIKWYAEIIMTGKAGKITKKQKEYLKKLYNGNERMIKLINVMLNISRLEAGKVKITLAPLSIKELLENIIAEQQVDIKKKKHKFTFECPNDLPKITTDSELIRMVFQNLISNAIKYTQDKGKIDCKVEKKDNSILFSVHDNGIGIPEDQQKKIFGKLFRADNAFSHDPQGNGLGLYAAKMTIENLGGKTWFESKADKGTTFYVELPVG